MAPVCQPRVSNTSECIASTCLSYLSFQTLLGGPYITGGEHQKRLADHAFLLYAAHHWAYHTYIVQDKVREKVVAVLQNANFIRLVCQFDLISDDWPFDENHNAIPTFDEDSFSRTTGIHLAACFGLGNVCLDLIHSSNVERFFDPASTQNAATELHSTRPTQLLGKEIGGEIANTQGEQGRTPLFWAAKNGHEATVKLLLDRRNVLADSFDNSGWTSLAIAAANGHEAVVKLLLQRDDVDANSKGFFDRTPLAWAATYGQEAVMKLLLDRTVVVAD